jgi:predicted acyl esterase
VSKLVDVYANTPPESTDQGLRPGTAGFALPIGSEIFRGHGVHGFDKPKALTPGKIEKCRFGLPNVDHAFLPGQEIAI